MIQLNAIHKVFNPGEPTQVTALDGVTLAVETGSFVVLVGANGSGKTTLLNVIAGAVLPSSGAVVFDGADVTRLAEHRRSRWVARVFQNPLSGTAPELSILDNFRLAALRTSPKGLRIGVSDSFRRLVRDRIATLGMGLEAKIDQPMGTLSGGQRQALTLLMSVMDKTSILLLDEPTAALDPRSAALIMRTADHLAREYRLTTILITHNLRDAHTYGNRLIMMSEGRVVRDLTAAAKTALQLADLAEWFG
ncbi:MAG TPA: ATP-binding cassette domain-containing protein [Dinghuibacter sp.]|uniref:ABC transporter ATP-binding protein n=1 Tax=Dinghuibacter sp. TaxID=2024697 RepID=UPI002CC09D5B|nr:ATP-binding cassette domain-containing protein [Dinghuibacter sp.]HTJ14160.1 ATP-binding cassette domain-containing protein [Dinghuibacter sp.]